MADEAPSAAERVSALFPSMKPREPSEGASAAEKLFPTMQPQEPAPQRDTGMDDQGRIKDVTRTKAVMQSGLQEPSEEVVDQMLRDAGKLSESEKPTAQPEPPQPAAPAEYEPPDLSDIEGAQFDQQTFEAFTPVAKDLGLSQEQVNKLGQFDAQRQAERSAQWYRTVSDWEAETTKTIPAADIEAAQSLSRDMPADVADILDRTGLGNHPAIVRWIAALAKGR